MWLVLAFTIVNISLTLSLFEIMLIAMKKDNKHRYKLFFGLIQPVLGIGSLLSFSLVIPYLTLYEREEFLFYGFILWAGILLLYLFTRHFKKQESFLAKKP